jgi:aminoglycoside phosphotransferase (APT) family kinase protein
VAGEQSVSAAAVRAATVTDAVARVALAASGTADIRVVAERPDATVVRSGGVVAKAHAAGTDNRELAVRLAVAAHPLLHGIFLPPSAKDPVAHVAGRPVTVWPFGEPVNRHDPDAAPWEAAGGLLARLHRVPTGALPQPTPPMAGPAKAARAVARMRAAAPDPVLSRAWERLPDWARNEALSPKPRTLCHGDLHLGQLVRHPAPGNGHWLLIDIDDIGLGAPSWDLARPAVWFAAGVLAPAAWSRFLGAYRAGGGPAIPADGDPWPHLDTAARALAVQTAARAAVKAAEEGRALDETERAIRDACARIADVSC